MNIMNNPALFDIPFEVRTAALQSVLLVCGYTWNEPEMIDLMDAIGAETNYANQSSLKNLQKLGPLMKGLSKLNIPK